jgi:hypothetical protein
MLEVLFDEDVEIKAACEYYIVDINGNYDSKGKYVWINEVVIGEKYKNLGLLKEFIKRICDKVPQAEFGYFWRQYKYPNRKVRIYTRRQWLNLVKEM